MRTELEIENKIKDIDIIINSFKEITNDKYFEEDNGFSLNFSADMARMQQNILKGEDNSVNHADDTGVWYWAALIIENWMNGISEEHAVVIQMNDVAFVVGIEEINYDNPGEHCKLIITNYESKEKDEFWVKLIDCED